MKNDKFIFSRRTDKNTGIYSGATLWVKKRKRAGALWAGMLCAALVFSMLPARQVSAEEGDMKPARIQLGIGDGQETPVFSAGENTSLEIKVKNSGNTDAQNVWIEPVIQNADDWPFDVGQMNYGQSLETVGAGQQVEAVWGGGEEPLTVRKDVTGKPYRLEFRLTYDDGVNSFETNKYVFVKTQAEAKEPSQTVSEEKTPEGGKNPVENPEGGNTAESPSGGTGFGGGAESFGSVLSAGEVYNSDPVAAGGAPGIIAGESGENGKGSVPRVIVTGFDTAPGKVDAGTNFTLTVHLKNTSKNMPVSNMLFDIQPPSSGSDNAAEAPAFLPASGSSSIYLEGIPAGETRDISIDLNARADLIQKPYSVGMSMKYEDSKAVQYESQSILAIPVNQKARFEFSRIQVSPETAAAGDEVNISCSLYNLGRVKMYNVKAKFEGKVLEGKEEFIGNLDSGATGTIDSIVNIKQNAAKGEKCRLIVSYEDDAGNISTAEQEFSVNIEKAEMDSLTDMDETAVQEEKSFVPAAAAVIGIIAASGGTAAVLMKRRKRKNAAEEEEFSDEME